MRRWIGIDPGLSGAVAVILGDDPVKAEILLLDTPTRKGNRGREYLPVGMATRISQNSEGAFAVLEALSIRMGESGGSALKIGRGGGLWEGILVALQVPYEIVPAATWKKVLGLVTGTILSDRERKLAARALAQQLFPQVREELQKRRPDFAEALLLAEYGRRRLMGKGERP